MKIQTFMVEARRVMEEAGFDFGSSTLQSHQRPNGRGRLPLVKFIFTSEVLARGFFYIFDEYVWESEGSSQNIIIKLDHDMFRAEQQSALVHALRAATKEVTPALMQTISLQLAGNHGNNVAKTPTPTRGNRLSHSLCGQPPAKNRATN